MKRMTALLLVLALLLCGCNKAPEQHTDLAATTWPVYCLCAALTEGTGLTLKRVISEPVSCLHDYSLTVAQMKVIQQCDLLICSGAGLEDFMQDALSTAKAQIDASEGLDLLPGEESEYDPHVWLDPRNALTILNNISDALCARYADQAEKIEANRAAYALRLEELMDYGIETLSGLSCHDLITFHDGFSYFARAFDLTILAAIEEEAGAEASAAALQEIIGLVEEYDLPAVFTEVNGSDAAAGIVSRETGCAVYALQLMMDSQDYCDAMRKNIDTIKEALQ